MDQIWACWLIFVRSWSKLWILCGCINLCLFWYTFILKWLLDAKITKSFFFTFKIITNWSASCIYFHETSTWICLFLVVLLSSSQLLPIGMPDAPIHWVEELTLLLLFIYLQLSLSTQLLAIYMPHIPIPRTEDLAWPFLQAVFLIVNSLFLPIGIGKVSDCQAQVSHCVQVSGQKIHAVVKSKHSNNFFTACFVCHCRVVDQELELWLPGFSCYCHGLFGIRNKLVRQYLEFWMVTFYTIYAMHYISKCIIWINLSITWCIAWNCRLIEKSLLLNP